MEENILKSQNKKITRSPEGILIEKEEFLKSLQKLRFGCTEEFPPEVLLPDHPNYHLYKYRTNYFSTIVLRIIRLKKEGLINSPNVNHECDEFLNFCKILKGKTSFYKQEDIDKANNVLDCLIKELS